MKKSILAMAVVAATSFGASATTLDTNPNSYNSWDEFYTAVKASDDVATKQDMVEEWALRNDVPLTFHDEGGDVVVKIKEGKKGQKEINLSAIKRGDTDERTLKDIEQLNNFKEIVVKYGPNGSIIADPINAAPTSGQETITAFNERFEGTGYSMNELDGVVTLVTPGDDVVLVDENNVHDEEAIKDLQAGVRNIAMKVIRAKGIENVDPEAIEGRMMERHNARSERRINDGLTNNEKAIAAHVIASEANLINSGKLENVIKYRQNNENKVEFTNEQKLTTLNKLAARGEHSVDGQNRFELVVNPNTGEKYLRDTSTGLNIKPDVVDAYIADAHKKIQEEAAKRAEEKKEPMPSPRDPIAPMPGFEPDAERVKEAVQSLANSGQSGATTMAELYAATDENALAINDLYSQIDRLDEKMDGVMAGTHAVNNARPFLSGEGQTAVGVGVGYAGESGAVAIGAAHSFTENWSASATLNVTTGSYSEVSGGAGVQYVF